MKVSAWLLAGYEHIHYSRFMKYAFDTPQFGAYADPRLLAQLAHEAEDAGWDAFFLWDHIQVGWPDAVADPWIALAAIAIATSRILIGPIVTPLYRRHPWKVARETVTLDHLSGGRVVLGVGLGDDVFGEIRTFDGPMDPRTRAAMLDEGLAVLLGLWSAEKFHSRESITRFATRNFCPRLYRNRGFQSGSPAPGLAIRRSGARRVSTASCRFRAISKLNSRPHRFATLSRS
jgi:alkanesulfonate monooxygenase SsuD/methylene tetrahydromethanopterin reductase-like flavin-dependent oxidoreductase (luciferase family)